MAVIFVPGYVRPALVLVGTPTTTGTVDTPIDTFTVVPAGGVGPYVLAITGAWPPGASVDSDTGIVTPGTATETHTYTGLSVRATDATGAQTSLPAFQIDVSA